jgi:bifunctional DNA-binding transcriptional regulator/antitoxin component of YhaV-PrlF toxin-antitoxin module
MINSPKSPETPPYLRILNNTQTNNKTCIYKDLEEDYESKQEEQVYIPRDIASGITEGTILEVIIESGKVILTPIQDPIWLALYGPKLAEISREDLEYSSEEEQGKICG